MPLPFFLHHHHQRLTHHLHLLFIITLAFPSPPPINFAFTTTLAFPSPVIMLVINNTLITITVFLMMQGGYVGV